MRQNLTNNESIYAIASSNSTEMPTINSAASPQPCYNQWYRRVVANDTSPRVIDWDYRINGPATALLILVGTVLNVVCVRIFMQPKGASSSSTWRKARPAINYYLITLAAWDIAACMGALLMYCMPTLVNGRLVMELGVYTHLLPYIFYMAQCTLTGTVWVIVALTVDRYVALCYPMSHTHWSTTRTKRLLVGVTVSAMTYSLPTMFELVTAECAMVDVDGRFVERQPFITRRRSLFDNDAYQIIYKLVCPLFLYSLVPFFVLFILTVRISIEMTRATRSRRAMSAGTSDKMCAIAKRRPRRGADAGKDLQSLAAHARMRTEKTPTTPSHATGNLMLMTVVLKFLVCRALITVLDVYEKVDVDMYNESALVPKLVTLSNFLVVLNSSTNFFVYASCSVNFRAHVAHLAFVVACRGSRDAADRWPMQRSQSAYDGGGGGGCSTQASKLASRTTLPSSHRLHSTSGCDLTAMNRLLVVNGGASSPNIDVNGGGRHNRRSTAFDARLAAVSPSTECLTSRAMSVVTPTFKPSHSMKREPHAGVIDMEMSSSFGGHRHCTQRFPGLGELQSLHAFEQRAKFRHATATETGDGVCLVNVE